MIINLIHIFSWLKFFKNKLLFSSDVIILFNNNEEIKKAAINIPIILIKKLFLLLVNIIFSEEFNSTLEIEFKFLSFWKIILKVKIIDVQTKITKKKYT